MSLTGIILGSPRMSQSDISFDLFANLQLPKLLANNTCSTEKILPCKKLRVMTLLTDNTCSKEFAKL